MSDGSQDMVAFLGVPADRRLLEEDLDKLPAEEQYNEPAVANRAHGRLVAAGSLLTGATLFGGVVLFIYGASQLLFNGGEAVDAVLAAIGILLVGTHWGWVHAAEYAGLVIDQHEQHQVEDRRDKWLATIQPYPRLSVSTSVQDDASTRVTCVLHRPVLTAEHTFTFALQTRADRTYDADASAEVIASDVETWRHQARLETDRLRQLWEAASSAYCAALLSAQDDEQRLAAQRAAAKALSDHINASLLEPPLVE